MSAERPREKLTIPITVKCDESMVAALDRLQRERERELGVPLTRGVLIRLLLQAQLEAK